MKMQSDWIHCPICGSKTRTKIRSDTVAVNLPVFCPKCKNTAIADVDGCNITTKKIIKQSQTPDAEPANL